MCVALNFTASKFVAISIFMTKNPKNNCILRISSSSYENNSPLLHSYTDANSLILSPIDPSTLVKTYILSYSTTLLQKVDDTRIPSMVYIPQPRHFPSKESGTLEFRLVSFGLNSSQ